MSEAGSSLSQQLAAEREYHRLRAAAETAYSKRWAMATSVAAADAALYDFKYALRRIDRMSEQQLLQSAERHGKALASV